MWISKWYCGKSVALASIVLLASLVSGCMLPRVTHPLFRKSPKKEKSACVKDQEALAAYNKINGTWFVKTSANKVVTVGNRKYLDRFPEHLRLYFAPNQAKMQVVGEVVGFVDLKFEGRNIYDSSNFDSVLEFTFPPLEDQKKEYHDPLPILMTGKIKISISKANTGVSYQLISGSHGRLQKAGNHYEDWTRGGSKKDDEHEDKLLETVNRLTRGGWRCIGQTEVFLNGHAPKAVNLSINETGRKLYLIYAPTGKSHLSYDLNHSLRRQGQYDYPTYITPNSFAHHRVLIDFDFDRNIDNLSEFFPPVKIKVLAFAESPWAKTGAPCEYKFRSASKYAKWLGYIKLYLAAIANKTQKESFIENNGLMYAISGLTRNELMSSGLKDIAPGLTDSEIGYLSRAIFPFFEGDLMGLPISVLRENAHQTLMREMHSIDKQIALKIIDVMVDLWIEKLRAH